MHNIDVKWSNWQKCMCTRWMLARSLLCSRLASQLIYTRVSAGRNRNETVGETNSKYLCWQSMKSRRLRFTRLWVWSNKYVISAFCWWCWWCSTRKPIIFACTDDGHTNRQQNTSDRMPQNRPIDRWRRWVLSRCSVQAHRSRTRKAIKTSRAQSSPQRFLSLVGRVCRCISCKSAFGDLSAVDYNSTHTHIHSIVSMLFVGFVACAFARCCVQFCRRPQRPILTVVIADVWWCLPMSHHDLIGFAQLRAIHNSIFIYIYSLCRRCMRRWRCAAAAATVRMLSSCNSWQKENKTARAFCCLFFHFIQQLNRMWCSKETRKK